MLLVANAFERAANPAPEDLIFVESERSFLVQAFPELAIQHVVKVLKVQWTLG